MQPSFDSPFRAVEHFRDFFDRQFLLIKQDEALLIFRSQRCQRLLNFFGIIARVRSCPLRQPIGLQVRRRRPTATFLQIGSTTVGCNGQQPWSQRTFGVPAMQVAEGSQKNFLRDVLGIVATTEHSQAKSKDHALKTLNEQPLARDIARQTTSD